VRRRRQLGTLSSLDAGSETLDEFFVDVWAPTYAVDLAAKTRKHYASLYDRHVGPFLGSMPLRALTPQVVARWQADRLAAGAGRVALRHAFELLGSILQRVRERAHRRQPDATGPEGEAAGARGGSPVRTADGRADARAPARERQQEHDAGRDADLGPRVRGTAPGRDPRSQMG